MTSTAAAAAAPLFCGLVIHGGVSQLALIGSRDDDDDDRPTVEVDRTANNGLLMEWLRGKGGGGGRGWPKVVAAIAVAR